MRLWRRSRQKPSVVVPATTVPEQARAQIVLRTWESEIRAIAEEATRWTVETGGDLFGRWEDATTIYLATRTGPNAIRDAAHFRLDVEYLRTLSAVLAEDWNLQYFGDWHSHHRLRLTEPSSGDQRRIAGVATRNHFARMAEAIVTFDDPQPGAGEYLVRLHSWHYAAAPAGAPPQSATLVVIPGESPVRETIRRRRQMPEQEFDAWSSLPLERIRLGSANRAPVASGSAPDPVGLHSTVTRQAVRALERASDRPVEMRETPFGRVLVVSADQDGEAFVAFAISAAWPQEILEIDWIDRRRGTAVPIQMADLGSLLDVDRVVAVYERAKMMQNATGGSSDVDGTAT